MANITVEVKIYEPDGSTPRQTFTEVIGERADEEMVVKGLTFDVNAIGGLGDCSFTLFKNYDDITAQKGDIVKIESESTVRYVGVITRIVNDKSTSTPIHEDKVFVQVESLLRRADNLVYNLEDPDGSRVPTNIQDVYDDIFQGGEFTGKNQDNNKDLETEIALINYNPANNVLPTFSINVAYKGSSGSSAFRDMLEMARGQVDLTAAETYIMYLKTDGEVHTKQRATDASPLLTVDIGSGSFPVKNSTYLEDDGYVHNENTDGIINEVIINDAVIVSTQYATEVAASIASHGTRQYTINNDKINIEETSEWLDGFILGLLEEAVTYRLHLNRITYAFSPIWFSGSTDVPDGYIEITKNAGVGAVATVPFQSATYTLDSGGWDISIVCGAIRPNINTRTNVLTEPANTDALSIDVSVYVAASEAEDFNVPSVITVSANDSFRIKINYSGDPSTITAEYSSVNVNLTKSTDTDEPNYYITDDMSAPAKGQNKVVRVVATDDNGKEVVSVHYVKGVLIAATGAAVSVTDPDTSADEDTFSAPEYTDKVRFEFQFDETHYNIAVTDVELRFYSIAGSLVKTLTSVSSPAITEPTDGTFVVDTDTTTLALSSGFYKVNSYAVKHESFIDEAGVTNTGDIPVVGAQTAIKLTGATVKTLANSNFAGVADHDLRLPAAETGATDVHDPGSGDVDSEIRFFAAGSAPDAGGAGWFGTVDNAIPGNWIRLSVDQTGTPDSTFTLNNDDTAGQYVTIEFNTDHATNNGYIRYDRDAQKLQTRATDVASWVDIATGISTSIEDTYSADVYRWVVDGSDGSVSYVKNPDGTPVYLFTISAVGEITTYDALTPDVDAQDDLGSASKRYSNVYLSDDLFVEDIVFTQDGGVTEVGKMELDAVNGQIIPHKLAIGFMDG